MPTIEVSADMYRRVGEFTKVVQAVLDEDVDTATSFGIVLERGLKAALGDIVAPQDESMLLESFHQIATRQPDAVYPYVANMIGLGADLREFKERQKRIGFRKSSRRKR